MYWYAPWVFFWGRQCEFVFPIYVRKYRQYTIDRRIMVYTVCASAMISPLRQWLDSYAKTRLKMLHTFKHFIQYFLLLTNLVIVFVIVSTGVLCEPRQCSLFGDYIPESKLCFCLNLCRSPGAYSIRPIQKLFNCQTTTRNQKTAAWLWVPEITWYLYTRGVRGRMKAKQRWFKVTRDLCHEWFHHFRHHVHDGHCHLTSTLFHSLVPWWHPRRIRPQITRLSQLENSAMGTWPTRLVIKMAI